MAATLTAGRKKTMKIFIVVVGIFFALAMQLEIAGPDTAGDHSGHVYASAQLEGGR